MNYIDFRARFHAFACFSNEQVLAAFPRFARENYSAWLDKGYIKRLRRSWYAFAGVADVPGIGDYFAGKIYSPKLPSRSAQCARLKAPLQLAGGHSIAPANNEVDNFYLE